MYLYILQFSLFWAFYSDVAGQEIPCFFLKFEKMHSGPKLSLFRLKGTGFAFKKSLGRVKSFTGASWKKNSM